jgi:hypothetical protein
VRSEGKGQARRTTVHGGNAGAGAEDKKFHDLLDTDEHR